MKIRFTPSARNQLLAAIAYVRRDDIRAARQLRNRIEKALRRLETHPDSGRRLPEFPDLPYREIVVPPYRVFYRVAVRLVWVVAVWHGAQIPRRPG